MYPGPHAATHPDKPAVVMAGCGRTMTYRELDDGSAALAKGLHDLGLRTDLIAFARSRVARYKAPRGVDFVDTLPRTPTGKLVKRRIVDGYLAGAGR